MTPRPIEAPPINALIDTFVKLAVEHPDRVTQFAYLNNKRPYDLIAHAYVAHGGKAAVFTRLGANLYKGMGDRVMASIFNEVFTPPMKLDLKDLSDRDFNGYMVYLTTAKVQTAQDTVYATSPATWSVAVVRGLRSLQAFLLDHVSGAPVQLFGQRDAELKALYTHTENAINTITKETIK